MPELPLVGTDFAGYRLHSVLGRGGMSIVYQAENPRLLSRVALKVLAPHLATDQVFRTRFVEESQIAASLNHPNVIPIHDFGDYGGLLYIVMQYVPGTDLGRLIAKHGWLPPGATVFLLEQAARALDAAHSRDLVHRDVKPGNLLIAQGGDDGDPDHLYLADFGITKYVGARTGLTRSGTVLGTVHYASPEQIQEQPVLGAADQYSLGCVLYECLTGRAPFEKGSAEAIMWAHVHELPVLPTLLRPDLPPAIDEVIARVLAKDPDDRYDNCRGFIADARDAIAPARSFQPAPVSGRVTRLPQAPAGGQRHPTAHPVMPAGQPGPRGAQRPYPTANPVPPGGRPGPPDAQPPAVPGDFRGQVDFGDQPVRRRRVRRRRSERPGARSVLSMVAIGVSAAVIAGGGAVAGVLFTKTGDTSTATPPAQASAPVTASSSMLYTALSQMASATGRLPMSTCKELSATVVLCTNPDQAVGSVEFVTFPSLTKLYQAYESYVGRLAAAPFASVENHPVCGDLAPDPTAENTWDHSDHYLTTYTAQQMAAGKVPDTTAMGRVFCQQTSTGSENIIWTQDSGRMLAVAEGTGAHHLVWEWFYEVHHFITFPGEASMPAMPGMPTTASGTATASS
jgi:serine/threonine-protein kinase